MATRILKCKLCGNEAVEQTLAPWNENFETLHACPTTYIGGQPRKAFGVNEIIGFLDEEP